jgi:hypothetical protein
MRVLAKVLHGLTLRFIGRRGLNFDLLAFVKADVSVHGGLLLAFVPEFTE